MNSRIAELEALIDWWTRADMTGPFCSLKKLQEILQAAPAICKTYSTAEGYAARQFGFLEGLWAGRAIYEDEKVQADAEAQDDPLCALLGYAERVYSLKINRLIGQSSSKVSSKVG